MIRGATVGPVLFALALAVTSDGIALATPPPPPPPPKAVRGTSPPAQPAPKVVQRALPPTPGPLDGDMFAPAELLPVQLLEEAPAARTGKPGLPLLRLLPVSDPRVKQAEGMLDNEAARFILGLLHRVRVDVVEAADFPALPIVLRKGGNHAKTGYRLLVFGGKSLDLPDRPYVELELDTTRFSHTLLHEGGHVVHRLCRPKGAAEAHWSAVLHSTFAVTDPATALSEGFAIHLETLWGHFGAEPDRRAYYHRSKPAFGPDAGLAGEYFWPVRDLLSFSQNWARYQAVRDATPAFSGIHHPGDYLRSQYYPARDFSELRPANAQISCEGTVAAVLFWTVAGWADAKPGGGLDQDSLLWAETTLATALQVASRRTPADFRPDLVDLVSVCGPASSGWRRQALEVFVGITRGVTARPGLRAQWRTLYRAALGADARRSLPAVADLEAGRVALLKEAVKDPAVLRAGLGPVLPVRVAGPDLEVPGFGMKFPREFDLNAATGAELALLAPKGRLLAERILEERDRKPFGSLEELERRTGLSAADAGLTPVALPGR